MTRQCRTIEAMAKLSSILTFLFLLAVRPVSGSETTSGDAYARLDEKSGTWTIGTLMVEQKLRFSGGTYTTVGFRNKQSGREYLAAGQAGEEFRVLANGKPYSGASGNWTWKGGEARVLGQGEIQLTVRLENDLLAVEKTYVVYPATSIIRQWIKYQNRSTTPIRLSNPYFLSHRLRGEEAEKLTLYYMTGGGSFTGSQMLQEVRLSKGYARTFDTKDKPERVDMAGLNFGGAMAYGSGVYMPWFSVSDTAAAEGFFVGLDYYGRWAAEIGNYQGGPGYLGMRLGGYEKQVGPGETAETPKAFTGVYAGDLDSMGNQLKDWQYRYMWDFTNDEYFAKVRFGAESRDRSGSQDNWDYHLAVALHASDVMRYVGADKLCRDSGWYNRLGDNDGPDFSLVNKYLRKYGMRLTIWWPLYGVARQSRVYQQHPEWRANTRGSGGSLDTSKKEVINYLAAQLDEKVAQWGDFEWRLDGTAVVPVDGNETPMLAQYHNVMQLKREFKQRHPGSGIDLCSGGGNLMGFEALRMSDVSQLTDGGSLHVMNYYSSYLFPPDKINDWTRNFNSTWENLRSVLTMAAAWMRDRGRLGNEPGLLVNGGIEHLRRTLETYHYLVHQGVAGRWSHVYHPRVEGDDPVYYLQRLSRDGKRGVIILKHFPKHEITIYPKGLHAQETYDVRFEMLKRMASRTGAELMKNGLRLASTLPGELIYLGLPNYPGSGSDHTPPSEPGSVRKRVGTNLGVTGVELEWSASTDNNWLSHYQIYRDGEVLDKVAKGTYYFDHSAGPENVSAVYQVQAIDGDGNGSRKVEAAEAGGGAETYTARGGYLAGKDYSYQGANGWYYEEWRGANRSTMAWNGALGQMGLYEGVAGAQKAVIGASWMRPGAEADAVRVFTLPHSGQITVRGRVHKDVDHGYGDGVQVKLLRGDEQVWPSAGWQPIEAADVAGASMEIKLRVRQGERLYFVANCDVNAVGDDTVWDPQITYDQIEAAAKRRQRTVVDNNSSFVRYRGLGWQRQGVSPYSGDAEQGHLAGRIKGTLSVSGTAGDKMELKFRGRGIELIGDTGSDRGIAAISLDGKPVATIDTFVPEDRPRLAPPAHEAARIASLPPIRLWGISGLSEGEHTLELTVTGHKNRESIGAFIGIDAIVILDGAPRDPTQEK